MESFRQRLGSLKGRELESVARTMGRRLDTQRGKEPTWISEELPDARPLSIPNHTRDLKKGTAGNIVDQLELDLEGLERKYHND